MATHTYTHPPTENPPHQARVYNLEFIRPVYSCVTGGIYYRESVTVHENRDISKFHLPEIRPGQQLYNVSIESGKEKNTSVYVMWV